VLEQFRPVGLPGVPRGLSHLRLASYARDCRSTPAFERFSYLLRALNVAPRL
jgi:hypothetical protein